MIHNLRLIEISGSPFYEFTVEEKSGRKKFIIADAASGEIRPAINEEEAKKNRVHVALKAAENKRCNLPDRKKCRRASRIPRAAAPCVGGYV